MIGMGWEGSGHGHSLPAWADPTDAEARTGTRYLRAVDPNLIVVRNRADGSFLICGPSLSLGGWVPIAVCMDDDGNAYTEPVPWPLIVQAQKNAYTDAEKGDFGPQKAARRAAEWRQREEQRRFEEVSAKAAYSAKAIRREANGDGRWSARDLSEGLLCVTEGRTKTPPRFRKTYSPGTVTPG